MIKLRNIFALLVLLSLISCDDKAVQPTTQRQQTPAPNNTQSIQGMEQLKARLAMNPSDFASLSELADMYFESGQYIDAFNTYDKAISVNPLCADCFNDRGLSLFYMGDVTSALESFDKAVEIDPTYKHAWLSKGFVLTSQGRYAEAVAPLNKVKELDGTGPLSIQADKFLAMAAKNNP
ncbi:tetratricopeptide repeat protein [Pseudomonadota bacterium]